ncbi:hypothetical protein V6N12_028455 [Hibiscus sabdariffa]|uniref:PHD-type zinc finger plants domain-containing protein n=1 Tax=Hibiscus sabdariffa TaxID=183260 RepID=A0ABR2F5V9_9ROSI
MCGDSGITPELFRCKICHFRSQHRYCSNLYPKSASYKVCNWCLKEKSQNSLNSSASCKGTIGEDDDDDYESKKNGDNNHRAGIQRNSNDFKQVIENPIKKPTLEEKLSPRRKRKRQEKQGSKNGVITRHVFRNKVRRYKLLEEVSS